MKITISDIANRISWRPPGRRSVHGAVRGATESPIHYRDSRCQIGPLPDALKPDFQGVRAHWNRGFMAFPLAWRTRTVVLAWLAGRKSVSG